MLEKNLSYAKGLNPLKSFFYEEFCRYCDSKNIQFVTVSGKRTYEQQCMIYSQGRTKETLDLDLKKGKITKKEYEDMARLFDSGKNVFDTAIRTNTIGGSEHLKGNAFDVRLINTTHSELELVANKWGIMHPLIQDPPHYSIATARPLPIEIMPEERLRTLERRAQNTKDPETKSLLMAVLERLRKRLGI